MKKMSIVFVVIIWIVTMLFASCYTPSVKDEKTGIQAVLDGKYLSVFGDSISTYVGVSDLPRNNKTLSLNRTHYYGTNGGVENQDQTWWGKLVNELQINLLINNSSSGAKVYGVGNVTLSEIDQGIGDRANNLHATRGNLNGKYPDIIIVFMGINDLIEGKPSGDFASIDKEEIVADASVKPSNFAEGYFMMINKIVNNYQNAKVFTVNLPNRVETAPTLLVEYNKIIKDVSEYFSLPSVDLYSSRISGKDYVNYTDGDDLHPNKDGMEIIFNKVKETIVKEYLG